RRRNVSIACGLALAAVSERQAASGGLPTPPAGLLNVARWLSIELPEPEVIAADVRELRPREHRTGAGLVDPPVHLELAQRQRQRHLLPRLLSRAEQFD